MKCNSCGFDNGENAKVCRECGGDLLSSVGENSENKEEKNTSEKIDEAVSENAGTDAEKDGKKKKRTKHAKESLAAVIVPICAVVLIALVLFLIISFIVETSEEPEIEDFYVSLYDDELDLTYFFFKGKLVSGYVYGKCEDPYVEGGYSADGTVVAVKCARKDEVGTYTLSVVTPNGINMVSDNIDGDESRVLVSEDGKYVAYSINSPGALYIYDVNSNKSEVAVSYNVGEFDFLKDCKRVVYLTDKDTLCVLEITSGKIREHCKNTEEYAVLDDGAQILFLASDKKLFLYTEWSNSTESVAEAVEEVCVSVGEKTFAYTVKNTEGGSSERLSYFRKGQKDIEIGKDVKIAAVSDDGKYIYTRGYANGDLFYSECGKDAELVFSGDRPFALSKDISEVIHTDLDGTYIFTPEKKNVKISESTNLSPVLFAGNEAERFSDMFYTAGVDVNGESQTNVIYVDGNFEVHEVLQGVEAFELSRTEDILFAQKDGRIYTTAKSAPTAVELCEGKLEDGMYRTAFDKAALYMKEKNEDGTYSLYWCDASGKKLISDRVVGNGYMSHDGYLFFAETPEEKKDDSTSETTDAATSTVSGDAENSKKTAGYPIYCVKDGGEKDFVADNVTAIRITKSSAYFIVPCEDYSDENKVYSVYGCVKGNKIKVIVERMTILEETQSEEKVN